VLGLGVHEICTGGRGLLLGGGRGADAGHLRASAGCLAGAGGRGLRRRVTPRVHLLSGQKEAESIKTIVNLIMYIKNKFELQYYKCTKNASLLISQS
jgi:hypothetical protein